MKTIGLVVSCEHGVNVVPKDYQMLFAPYEELLQSHRGIDFGALAIAKALSEQFSCHFIQAKTTRLLIDCNRSLSNRACFSEITSSLSTEEKNQLIKQYYLPFRQQVEKNIKEQIQQGKQVLHLSVHSFTPNLNGYTRSAALGFLYDPKRATERELARLWQKEFKQNDTNQLSVRLNYPYRGVSDGFTTALRKKFAEPEYAGIEIEINQGFVEDTKFLDYFANLLPKTLKPLILRA